MIIKVERRGKQVWLGELYGKDSIREGYMRRGQRIPYETLEEAKKVISVIRMAIKLGHSYETCREALIDDAKVLRLIS
jgi:hypothetical protein